MIKQNNKQENEKLAPRRAHFFGHDRFDDATVPQGVCLKAPTVRRDVSRPRYWGFAIAILWIQTLGPRSQLPTRRFEATYAWY
jgi:hypothetical protein